MNITENTRTACKSIAHNKLRSFLTLTGIIIGIFSITSVMSVLGIMQAEIEKNLNVMGTNTFYIHLYPVVDLEGKSDYQNRKKITFRDYQALKQKVNSADFMAASIEDEDFVSFGKKTTKAMVEVTGITSEWIHGSGYSLETGRFFTENDIRGSRHLAVIGHDIQKKLMPNINPVGQKIHINGYALQVIGVLKKKGAVFGESLDNIVLMPLSVHNNLFGIPPDGLDISVTVGRQSNYAIALDEATAILRQIRKVPFGKKNDFEITSNKSLIDKFNSMTINVKIAAMAAGTVALLAAGIGIMNIMLVTVTERTKEVGIRKSLGATKVDILFQFLMEAIVLTIAGGITGVVFGALIVEIIAFWMDKGVIIPWKWMGIGIVVCTFTGAVFGVYPALKAASLDPVDAFRS